MDMNSAEVGGGKWVGLHLSSSHWHVDHPSIYPAITEHLTCAGTTGKTDKDTVLLEPRAWQETQMFADGEVLHLSSPCKGDSTELSHHWVVFSYDYVPWF